METAAKLMDDSNIHPDDRVTAMRAMEGRQKVTSTEGNEIVDRWRWSRSRTPRTHGWLGSGRLYSERW